MLVLLYLSSATHSALWLSDPSDVYIGELFFPSAMIPRSVLLRSIKFLALSFSYAWSLKPGIKLFEEMDFLTYIPNSLSRGFQSDAQLFYPSASVSTLVFLRSHLLRFLCTVEGNTIHYTNATATESLQSCPTLCDPMDCSLPSSSVHGILQARIWEWTAMPSSRGPSWPRDWAHVSCISCTGIWVLYQ